jgi:hypothetical protein
VAVVALFVCSEHDVAKTPPPLLGFNNNVRHHGRIFHIQTEDSGVKRPHIITHLFGDGGRILKTLRTDYGEHLDNDEMPQVVRRMMKEQHKAMFVALRSGQLDPAIVDAFGPSLEADESPKSEHPLVPAPAPSFESHAATPEEFAARAAPLPTPMPEEWRRALEAVAAERPGSFPDEDVPAPAGRRMPTPPPASYSIEEAVEKMAAKAAGLPLPDSPPTPPDGSPLAASTELVSRRPAPETPGRYSISRPASIFSEGKRRDGASIFGDSLIGEKSLDEVILSYLAEDLENPSTK